MLFISLSETIDGIMKFGKIGIFFILIAGALVWWGSRWYKSGEQNLPPLNTVQADYGDVSQRIVAHGRLEPIQKVTVGSQISGIIEDITVDFNSRVARGQIIAQIDSSTFAAAVSSAQAQLESAEAGLELARMQYKRVQELRERQFVSPSELDEASSKLRQAEAQVKVQRHSLEQARRELDRTTITAPADGIVISRNVEVGQTVAASLNAPELFLIATDLSEMHIYANVAEADIGQVLEGQRVIFQVDAYRGRDFTGEVIQVRNAPIVENNVVHYQTIIAVENKDLLLKPGMTAEVSIISNERQNVLRVRNTALRARLPDNIIPEEVMVSVSEGNTEMDESDGNYGRVYVLNDDKIESRRVRTGLSDGLHTEITNDAISENETLVVGVLLSGSGNEGGRSLLRGRQAQY